ncbi:MAG: ABC transporter permease subunit [Motiliproteus sp.]
MALSGEQPNPWPRFNPWRIAGYLALSGALLLTLLAFQGLIGFNGEGPDWSLLSDGYFHQILQFSIFQALLSALLSVALAWPIARALYYLPRLRGRRAFLNLCLLCFVMPTLIVITGLVALLGRSGQLSGITAVLFGDDWNIYGLSGILLAHLFLNMPFAVRVFYQQLQAIPDSSWKLAAQLKLSPQAQLRLIEWPGIRNAVLTLLGFIFVLCFNSFAIVLALGGGPRSTTLEVAIYQALKYDFNIPEALTLAWTQLLIVGGLWWLVSRLGNPVWLSIDTASRNFTPVPSNNAKRLHRFSYYTGWLLLSLPLLALLPGLLNSNLQRFNLLDLLHPTLISLGLALLAACCGMTLAYLILKPIRWALHQGNLRRGLLLEWLASHQLVAPAMVISVGLFVLLLPRIDLDRWGMLWVAILNTAMVLPFAIHQLKPRLVQFDSQYQTLSRSLKLSGWQQWQIEWPFIQPVMLSTFALTLVLALGDVAIYSIFGTQQWQTLPWLIYSYAGSYRIAEACLASLLLLALCALILWLIEWLAQRLNNRLHPKYPRDARTAADSLDFTKRQLCHEDNDRTP